MKSINIKESYLEWTAHKVTGSHHGKLLLDSAKLNWEENIPVDGSFIIDMNTLTVEDLKPGKTHDMLLNHLRSDDFFSIDTFPTSTLTVESVESASEGFIANCQLTIKDITNSISIPFKLDKNTLTGTATVDRTLFDIKFRSGKFFSDLGDSLIKDEFTVEINLSIE